jgi:hypothetical protein
MPRSGSVRSACAIDGILLELVYCVEVAKAIALPAD